MPIHVRSRVFNGDFYTLHHAWIAGIQQVLKRAIPDTDSRPPPRSGDDQGSGDGSGPGSDTKGRLSTWLGRSAGFWVASVLAALILTVPAWLMADELRYSILMGDDFFYIADALDWQTAKAHLFKPHNTHIVPLFRLWTATIVALAGPLEDMPAAFRAASYFGLIVTMLSVFLLVASESGRTNLGLAAMAGMGLSTVVQPAVSWYSAGQALWAGAGIVLTLILARAWSRHGGVWRLLLVALACLAAPLIWSGGLLAGPAATAYIIAKSPSRNRGLLVALVFATALAGLIVVGLSLHQIAGTNQIWKHDNQLWPRPVQAWLHTAQAITETLVLANLGLDAITSPSQATVLVAVLVGIWLWSRGGVRRFNPLEAAGAVVVVGSYLLVYFFRGNFPYSSLRDLGWYSAVPQVGAVLFAAGWWQSLRPDLPHSLTRIEAVVVLGFVGMLCVLHAARAERTIIKNAPALYPSEAKRFPIPALQRLRALYFKEELLGRQVRALARLTKAKSAIARLNASPVTLRRIYGRVLLPGIPEQLPNIDAFSLLKFQPEEPTRPPELLRIHRALDDLIRPESEPRPEWLEQNDPWPRP
jgi:hypothetical protein